MHPAHSERLNFKRSASYNNISFLNLRFRLKRFNWFLLPVWAKLGANHNL